MMSFMLIGQYALNAQLLATLVAVGLYWLDIVDMLVAELGDKAVHIDHGLVAVQV